MDKDLVSGKLGAIGSYDVAIKDGKLVAQLVIEDELIANGAIDMLEKAIPGDQTALAELLKSFVDKIL